MYQFLAASTFLRHSLVIMSLIGRRALFVGDDAPQAHWKVYSCLYTIDEVVGDLVKLVGGRRAFVARKADVELIVLQNVSRFVKGDLVLDIGRQEVCMVQAVVYALAEDRVHVVYLCRHVARAEGVDGVSSRGFFRRGHNKKR